MNTKTLFFIAAILAGFLLSRLVFGGTHAAVPSLSERALEAVNVFRLAAGEKALLRDRKLDRAAERHARAMAAEDFFSHTGADGSIIGQRVREEGYNWRLVAENIAAGMSDPGAVVESWVESPGHRRNMLLPGLLHAGVAHVSREPDPGRWSFRDYWVLVLAAPAKHGN